MRKDPSAFSGSAFVPRNFSETRMLAAVKAQRPPLSPYEATRPYAKYYDIPVATPDPGHREKMDQPISPAQAYGPEDINCLLDEAWLEGSETAEVGWSHLTNGAGYIANALFWPGVTAEMINWWFVWHALEDLRYRLWYPPQHGGIGLSPADRSQLLNNTLPLAVRNYGVTHFVVEDTNTGMAQIDIHWMSPAEMGFNTARFGKTIAASAMGQGWACPVEEVPGIPSVPSIMCHVFYPAEGGLLQRTRFWQGYGFNTEGAPECVLPPGVQVPDFAVQGLARHAVDEFSRLRAILPDLYREFGGAEVSPTPECPAAHL